MTIESARAFMISRCSVAGRKKRQKRQAKEKEKEIKSKVGGACVVGPKCAWQKCVGCGQRPTTTTTTSALCDLLKPSENFLSLVRSSAFGNNIWLLNKQASSQLVLAPNRLSPARKFELWAHANFFFLSLSLLAWDTWTGQMVARISLYLFIRIRLSASSQRFTCRQPLEKRSLSISFQ